MQEILKKIHDLIETYESGVWVSLENLLIMQRELSSNIYFLSKHNITFHKEHNAVKYKHKGSLGAGAILADEQWPELRQCRKIMESANNVLWSMRSELSIIKKEN